MTIMSNLTDYISMMLASIGKEICSEDCVFPLLVHDFASRILRAASSYLGLYYTRLVRVVAILYKISVSFLRVFLAVYQ